MAVSFQILAYSVVMTTSSSHSTSNNVSNWSNVVE